MVWFQFVPEGDDRNSSSIVDLFGSLNSPIDFILDLDWPDEYHNARFLTRLASVSLRVHISWLFANLMVLVVNGILDH